MSRRHPEIAVFGNTLLLTNILSYCDCNSLKSARRASRQINSQALPIFRKKAAISFSVTAMDKSYKPDELFSNKLKTFKKLSLQTLRFTRDKDHRTELSMKKVHSLTKLFATCRQAISTVVIDFEYQGDNPNAKCVNQRTLLRNMFRECTNLKELKVKWDMSSEVANLGINRSLKVLRFSEHWYMDEFEYYLNLFPSLEELSVSTENGAGQFSALATYGAPQIRQLLPNLKTFRIIDSRKQTV